MPTYFSAGFFLFFFPASAQHGREAGQRTWRAGHGAAWGRAQPGTGWLPGGARLDPPHGRRPLGEAGKKSLKMKEIILNSSKDFNGTLTDPEMLELTKLARGTYYKYKRELRQTM